jgi:UDP-N-acetylglucosamine--N-acetylmuramyl-(pentapeptide) pyrophosphoryl-undecaprenol N-acetylglucosamine transferase
MTRRLALAVGDTAGHVNPALAIADAYRALFGEVDVLFLAAGDGPASRLVPAAGYDLALVPALPLARTGVIGKLDALARIGPCIVRARRTLRDRGSRLVIGSGGYASGGVLLAARMLGLPTAILEPNVELGLANRLLKPVAKRAYVTAPEAARNFSKDRVLLTGTPVRRSLAESLMRRQSVAHSAEAAKVLVTSGSRGDMFLSQHVPALLATLQPRGVGIEVLHQTGQDDLQTISEAYARVGVRASVVPGLGSMADAYNWATFAIARAGASTLAELALAKLPSLLIPLADAAADHQAANAARFAAAGAAIWTRESEWDASELAVRLADVMLDGNRWRQMAESAHRLARPDAAERIVHDCENVMVGRW